ncbi:MAG: phage tail tape measure protein [bacterium]|nr:phage tail tape measure protein [bacterium]
MKNKIKIESFVSQDTYSKLEEFEHNHGLTKAEIIRRSLAFWLYFIDNFFPLLGSVEKELSDINKILSLSNGNLQNFATELFNIAKNTKQPFKSIQTIAQEFAKQGLSVEDTLKRTKDALILSQLSGMEVKESVDIITSTLNSFNKETLNSTDIINKLAMIDANYSVSSNDLAQALVRTGKTANDVGVSLDKLISVITTSQQMTARGGEIIGNSLKCIFQRLSNPDIRKQLQKIAPTINDSNSAIQNFEILAIALKQVPEEEFSRIVSTMGFGIYQENLIKIILKDLSDKDSIYYKTVDMLNNNLDRLNNKNK